MTFISRSLNFRPLVNRRIVAVYVPVLLLLFPAISPEQVQAQAPTPVFSIPISDLVFDGTVILPSGTQVKFSVREGSILLLDPPIENSSAQIGLVFRLDREEFKAHGRRTYRVLPLRVVPLEIDSDDTQIGVSASGAYKKPIEVSLDEVKVRVSVDSDHFEDFNDAHLVTRLWEAVRTDPNALDSMYSDLYTLYGPRSAACCIVDGFLVCSTTLSGCGGGGYNGA